MDLFVRSLPATRKAERRALILRELELRSDRAAVLELLSGIADLGRKWERLLINVLLESVNAQPESLQSVLCREFLDSSRGVSLVIHGKETGADLRDMVSLLGRLERISRHSRPRPILNIQFDTQDAYVYGLCAIAAWTSAHSADITFKSEFPRVKYFLERAGVIEGIRDPSSEPVRFDTETILGFTRIDAGKRFETDAHAGRLVRLFRHNMDLSEQTAQALSISFAELIENAIKHGEISSPAWLFANYHPQPQKMHICICDRGIGVKQTFEKSSNPRLRELAGDGLRWIREAAEPLVTSKSEGHAGYGLYLARELCRRNGGLFAIISGNAGYSVHPRSPDAEYSDVEELASLETPWRGTLVALQFRLDRPLKLGPIYSSLPSPDDDESFENVSLFDD
ncbi:ATP-binding protein [Planctellipticum variicoloris]|uniref:ATP-binding protein n=1 Tax=Planctellipticum variicoloris TaxID=3064265 RepID=UPI002CC83F44|nr:ATP-binding protein [Planctomycetaceae bacterium SH412]HTN00272.1 ATP-binding protein [Planctomycetaceae bacterium]